MSVLQNKYTPEQAAKFLNITIDELNELNQKGQIRQWQYKKERYYLGGELDALKMTLQFEYENKS